MYFNLGTIKDGTTYELYIKAFSHQLNRDWKNEENDDIYNMDQEKTIVCS